MTRRRFPLDALAMFAGLFGASVACGTAAAQHAPAATAPVEALSFDAMPAHVRDGVRLVLTRPTLQARGPAEIFRGNHELYQWLLDHPDRGIPLWKRMGAKCVDIRDRGNGRFGCNDGQGCDIHWETVCKRPGLHVWYAEGEGKPGPLLPPVLVRAVVVLRYQHGADGLGRTVLQQQADLFLQTDSKAVALLTKLMGASAPQLARQCVGQMEIFFSFPVAYLERYPERAEPMLIGGLPADAPAAVEFRRLIGKS